MAVRRFHHFKTNPLKQVFRKGFDLLTVLQTASCMISNADALGGAFRQIKLHQKLTHILCEISDLCGLFGLAALAEHMTVVFHSRAAARGVDHNTI